MSVGKRCDYDVALSFAGEDRVQAKALANALTRRNITVFYDHYEKAILWGKDLYTYLSDVYRSKAHYCVILISQHYAVKLWTNHERQAAQARAFNEHKEYILPLRLDDTEIPGVLPTIGYVSWHAETPETIADMIAAKLGKQPLIPNPPHKTPATVVTSNEGLTTDTDRLSLYDALCTMLPAQFAEVLFRLKLHTAHLSASSVPQAERAIEIIRLLEQPGDAGLAELESVIRRVAPNLIT